jgi:8-oxo-dGTP pyrophosphatase MutT (NUDIX family)
MAKRVERGGLVPFYVNKAGEVKMMFMKPADKRYGGPEFQLAKGRVDPGENPLEATLREANEELGLRESNIKWVRKVGVFLNTHHIYIAEVNTRNDNDFDKPMYETGATKWMTEKEFISEGRKLHVPIVKACARTFRKRD